MKQIPLKQGKHTIVDDEDFEYLSQWKWHLMTVGYAARHRRKGDYGWRNYNTGIVYMHRVILNTPEGKHTDHINGNKLDNRRSNLRTCSNAENIRNIKIPRHNTSGFKGVSWDRVNKKYKVKITFNRKYIFLGRYQSPTEAALAYNVAAKKHYGEFARLNIL